MTTTVLGGVSEKRSKKNNDIPQSKKINPEIDDDDFELPVSTLKVNKTNKKRVTEDENDDDDFDDPIPKTKNLKEGVNMKKTFYFIE